MKKALFFDLDGTLWDALVPLTESWNEAMISHNLPYRFTIDTMKSYMGLTPEETCPKSFPGTTLEEGLKLFKIVLDAEIDYLSKHPGTLYPNERLVLSILKEKYPLYVVSNADKGYIENYLSACHMEDYFVDHVCAGDTGLAKWQNIMYLKKKEGIDQVIYIGDTLKDKVETLRAGELFIHAAYGFGVIDEDEHYINSLDELPDLVEKLFALAK